MVKSATSTSIGATIVSLTKDAIANSVRMSQGSNVYRVTIHVKHVMAWHQSRIAELQSPGTHRGAAPSEAILRLRRRTSHSHLFINTCELLKPKDEFRTHSFQLLGVGRGEFFEHILPATRELDENLPAVLG